MHYSGLKIEDENFTPSRFQREAELIKLMQRRIRGWQRDNLPPFMTLPEDDSILKTVKRWNRRIRKRARQLIVFGIGGSSLGGSMLVDGLKKKSGLPVSFNDNVDPDTLSHLAGIDWKRSFLLVVSKSGGTAETLSQFLTTLPALKKNLGGNLGKHVAVITENPQSDLGKIAASLDIPIIPHPPVGGRFSALSVVGLLPAAGAGVDVKGVMAGARAMLKSCKTAQIKNNPALRGAIAQYYMAKDGKNISVYMSYGKRLDSVAAWQAQLWGESLGKSDADGVRHGLTPTAARGVTDQHSQLQLYLDGPQDKQYTLFYDPAVARRGRKVGKKFKKLTSVAPLAGHSTGALFAAEFKGTRDAMINRNLPVRTLNIKSRDAGAVGALIILLESETVIVAELLGINAYDQPAVEESKIRARQYLAKSL